MSQFPIQQAFNLALQHHQSGRLHEAEQLYRQIVDELPDHAGALHYLGVLEHQQGRNEIAIGLIRRAIALNPNLPEAHNNLGLALKANGQPGQAIAAYQRAIALRPDYPTALDNLAIALQSKGELADAIDTYRKSLAVRPSNVQSLMSLGDCLWGARKLDEAIAAYQQAIALGPDLPDAQRRLRIARQEKVRDRPSSNRASGALLRSGAIKYAIETDEKYGQNGASILTPMGRLLVYRRGDGESDGLRYLWLDQKGGGGFLPQLWGGGDPRLIWHDGKLLVCNNYGLDRYNERMEIQEVVIDGRDVSTRTIARFETVPGFELNQREKNWCPFWADGRLYFEYSVEPHVILAYDPQENSLAPAFTTTAGQLPFHLEGVGRLRLNTPAVALGGPGPDQTFLSVFHAALGRDYYSAFYQFSACPPFQLIAMSRSPVLWPEDADGIAWRQLGWRVLFIQSLELNESEDRVVMFGGDNDHACARIEMKLSSILGDMAPVGEPE